MEKVFNIKYDKKTGALRTVAQMILNKKITKEDKAKAWERFDYLIGMEEKSDFGQKFIEALEKIQHEPSVFDENEPPELPELPKFFKRDKGIKH